MAGLLTSFILTWLGLFAARHPRLQSALLPFAIALAFVAGYAVLPRDFAGFVPEPGQPWKWLPYLAVLSAAIPSALSAFDKPWAAGLALFATMPIIAICLKPNWPVWSLEPPTSRWLLLAYLLLVGLPLALLPPKRLQRGMLLVLAVTATVLALATGALISTRFAQLAAIASCSFLGAGIATRLVPSVRAATCQPAIPLYCTLVAGTAWIASVDPDPPAVTPLLIPVLPLCLWVLAARDAWFSPANDISSRP